MGGESLYSSYVSGAFNKVGERINLFIFRKLS